MTWVYIALAVVVILWATWVTCQAMYLMGRDVPKPPVEESAPVLCFHCGRLVPDAELGSHSCGTDDTQ